MPRPVIRYSKLDNKVGRTSSRFFVEKLYICANRSFIGAAKVLQSRKNTMEISDSINNFPLKNAKIRTKTHEMDALEDRALKSHNRSPGFESLCAHPKMDEP